MKHTPIIYPDDTPLNRWHAIQPYGSDNAGWQGRAQITDGHTTEAESCKHVHGSEHAAWDCGRKIAAQLQDEEVSGR